MITGARANLHLRDGMAAVKEKVKSGKVVRPAPTQQNGKNRHSPFVAAPYFVVDMFESKEPLNLAHNATNQEKAQRKFWSAVEGCGVVEVDGTEPLTFAKGDAAVIPASWGVYSASAVVIGVSQGLCAWKAASRAGDKNVVSACFRIVIR